MARDKKVSRVNAYWFDFIEPPEVGHLHKYHGYALRLVGVTPYVTRDGRNSFVLEWSSPDGRTGTTGLRSRAITWKREESAA